MYKRPNLVQVAYDNRLRGISAKFWRYWMCYYSSSPEKREIIKNEANRREWEDNVLILTYVFTLAGSGPCCIKKIKTE